MSDPKNTQAFAISSGVPPLFKGIEALHPSTTDSSNLAVISVSMNPGAITFDLMFLEPNSNATDLENPMIPDLEAAN